MADRQEKIDQAVREVLKMYDRSQYYRVYDDAIYAAQFGFIKHHFAWCVREEFRKIVNG